MGSQGVEYNVGKYVRNTDTTMEDQLKYKYILMLEGNDVATGLKWQLISNSVVFMARPTCVSFAMVVRDGGHPNPVCALRPVEG